MVYGLDMVGPLHKGEIDNKYLLVMVDKFTNWIEAKPVITQNLEQVNNFISGVVHYYGMPHNIIKEN